MAAVSPGRPVLFLIACGAAAAIDVPILARQLVAAWDVWPITTPAGRSFVDVEELAVVCGHPVYTEYRTPDAPQQLPRRPDAVVIAPATCNTIAKLAAGISDTLALGLAVEAIGWEIPLVIMPYTNRRQYNHPAIRRAIADLRSWPTVTVLDGEDVYPMHEPGQGDVSKFPWLEVPRALAQVRVLPPARGEGSR
jgi:phosphopantothenoylcysteine synthetase/decarboxylase